MGMAFNRSVWEDLKTCARTFCTYDDYNWDWSLLAVSVKCLPRELATMVLRAPRVFHIGEWYVTRVYLHCTRRYSSLNIMSFRFLSLCSGVHHKNSCKNMSTLRKVQTILREATSYLFPQKLFLTRTTNKRIMKKAKSNGGWGDIRDHNLCLRIVAAES